MSEEGYVFWSRGQMWFNLCHFRDNILLACNLNAGSTTNLVQEVCETWHATDFTGTCTPLLPLLYFDR